MRILLLSIALAAVGCSNNWGEWYGSNATGIACTDAPSTAFSGTVRVSTTGDATNALVLHAVIAVTTTSPPELAGSNVTSTSPVTVGPLTVSPLYSPQDAGGFYDNDYAFDITLASAPADPCGSGYPETTIDLTVTIALDCGGSQPTLVSKPVTLSYECYGGS
jgi:hypothetical protein